MAKPKMDARAKMTPHDDQGERLLDTAERIGNPDGGHHVSVGGLEAQREADHPGPDHVDEDQRHDHQPEPDLNRLPRRHPQGAPSVDSKQRNRKVDQEGSIKENLSDGVSPDLEHPTKRRLGGLEGDQAERVVEEVDEDVGGDHKPRPKPHAPFVHGFPRGT